MEAWGPMGMNRAVGMKNGADSMFLSCVIKKTTERGHRRNLGPVDIMVSALYNVLVGARGVDE
jgi:hypothetical protein